MPFLRKGFTSAVFKQGVDKDDLKELLMFVHKKSTNMSKFSLITLMGMSECWQAFFLSNLSMSFFMSSILSSEKWIFFFSQLLCIASMLGWSLYLKITLRVGSAMFFVRESNSPHLDIFRFFTIMEKKLFRVSELSDIVFKISPFSLILIPPFMRDLSERKAKVSLISNIVCHQLRFLYLSFPCIHWFAKTADSNCFAYYKEVSFFFGSISQKIIPKFWPLHYFFRKLFCDERHLITPNILNILRSMLD